MLPQYSDFEVRRFSSGVGQFLAFPHKMQYGGLDQVGGFSASEWFPASACAIFWCISGLRHHCVVQPSGQLREACRPLERRWAFKCLKKALLERELTPSRVHLRKPSAVEAPLTLIQHGVFEEAKPPVDAVCLASGTTCQGEKEVPGCR